jgi:hypothetical protein
MLAMSSTVPCGFGGETVARTGVDYVSMASIHYTAVVDRTLRVGFRCAGCGKTATAIVPVKAAGYQKSRGLRANPSAERAVSQQAVQGAERLATLTASLAPCPACGARDQAALAAFKQKTTIVSAIGGGLLLAGTLAMASGLGPATAIVGSVLLIVGVTMAITGLWSQRSTLSRAESLRFEAEPAR